MLVIGSIVSDFATGIGLLAGMIAIVGFLAHARPVLRGEPESEVRRATVRGGLVGCLAAGLIIVLSAIEREVVG